MQGESKCFRMRYAEANAGNAVNARSERDAEANAGTKTGQSLGEMAAGRQGEKRPRWVAFEWREEEGQEGRGGRGAGAGREEGEGAGGKGGGGGGVGEKT